MGGNCRWHQGRGIRQGIRSMRTWLVQQRQARQECRRAPRGTGEQHQIAGREAADGRIIEHLGRVLEAEREFARVVVPRSGEGEVEGRYTEVNETIQPKFQRAHLPGPGRDAQEVEHHLEHRAAAQRALGRQGLDELLERQALMSLRIHRGGSNAGQQLAEGGVVGQVRPQHNRIDEESDHRLDFGSEPALHRRTDNQIRGPAPAVEQCLEAGEQRHEERGTRVPGQGVEGLRQCSGHRHVMDGADQRLFRGPRAVGGQFEYWRQTGQSRPPPGEVRLEAGAAGRPLPGRGVRVLQFRRRQRGRCPRQRDGVEHGQFLEQQLVGSGIGDQVCHRQAEDVLPGRHPQQRRPPQRTTCQVEGFAGKTG